MHRMRQMAVFGGAAANDGHGEAAAVVNAEVIADLEALGSTPAFVERLVRVFWADNLRLVARMESAPAGRDLAEFRNCLHAMRGSAAGMGAERLTALCRDLASLPDTEIRARIPALAKSLRRELEATRAALEQCVQEHRKSAV